MAIRHCSDYQPLSYTARTIMLRRTKIVATLGPATSSPEALESIIKAGTDVVRLNFSHGEADDHRARASLVREIAARQGRFVAILADMQGPKIRISRFVDKKIELANGDTFTLDAELGKEEGTKERVGIDFKSIIQDVKVGDVLLLDDGRIELEVTATDATTATTKVLVGGPLSNNKGINLKGGGLNANALTDKDKADIKVAASINADYVAISFPRDEGDMIEARELLNAAGSDAGLIAKIERAEAVADADNATLDRIIAASEGVMVARGDLAVEIGDAPLAAVQKNIIARARLQNKMAITATQMMESMINSPMPTRAEVLDVANAVLDGTDAVMLSAETAAGSYPQQTVEAMARVILGAEEHPLAHTPDASMEKSFEAIDETIALSAMYAANHLDGVKAVICMTQTGLTARLMSRIKSSLPIFAFSPDERTQHKVALYRGVTSIPFDLNGIGDDKINEEAIKILLDNGLIEKGDRVVITKCDHVNVERGTNTMKIAEV